MLSIICFKYIFEHPKINTYIAYQIQSKYEYGLESLIWWHIAKYSKLETKDIWGETEKS